MAINQEKNARARGRLIESLRTGTPLAVTGAGVSVWAGYGTWKNIIDDLASAVREREPGLDTERVIQDNPNPLHCAKRLGAYLGPRFREFIRAEFGPKGQNPDDVLFTLCGLPFRHFLTLNIDCSLEQIHITLQRSCLSVTTSNLRDLTTFMRGYDVNEAPRRVLHFHGSYDDLPELIALTNDGYARLYQDGSLFRRFVWWLVTSQCLVFLGFGFKDSDFLNVMRQAAFDLADGEAVHFAIRGIWPDENDEGIRNDLNDSYRIDPVFYELKKKPDNSHAGFAELIRGIAAELELPEVTRPSLHIQDHPPIAPAEAEDIRRAEQLGAELVERLDPGGDGVPN